MRVLAFGTYDKRSHPRVAVLIQGFRDHGHEVDEVNRPLGISTAQRIAFVRQPWRLPLLGLRLLRCWAELAWLGLRARRRAQPDVVLVGYLGHFDVHLARLVFRGSPIIVDHLVSAAQTVQDRGLTGSGGLKARLMRGIDAAALGAADVVLVDTDQRLENLPVGVRDKTAVCPVGATDEWFAAGAAALQRGPRPALRVVFVGLYTPLHGTPVLAEALGLLAGDPSVEVTMVGDGQDRPAAEQRAAANSHVTWVDWVPSEDLPSFVADHDVSLGIFGTTTKATEVVPTKAFQGAAAGTVVVTSDTAPQRATLGDAAVLVPAGDASAIADTIRGLAGDPAALAHRRRQAYAHASAHFTAAAVVQPAFVRIAALPGNSGAERLP